VQRARLTLALAAHPEQSHAQIAAHCGLDRDTVYKWRRRWAQAGWSLEDAPRSGRPRTFSP
jgi:transposase